MKEEAPLICLVHHGDRNACARAMAEPERAFLFTVLRKRVKQKKRQLVGQVFKSDVIALLNKSLSKADTRASAQIERRENLLSVQQFWHDLRLLCVFEDVGLLPRAGKRERAVKFSN